jgi:hypothetical protein
MERYGPMSYYTLGRTYARERLRDPYFRDPAVARLWGLLSPPPDPLFRRLVCLAPPARVDEVSGYAGGVLSDDARPARLPTDSGYAANVTASDARPSRVESDQSRPARRDECR